MKSLLFFVLLMCICYSDIYSRNINKEEKRRIIVTTDLGGADPDDTQSLLHLLLSSDVIDIEGIISSNAWVDEPDNTDEILKIVDGYEKVLPILKIHSKGFPDADYLKSVVKRGQNISNMSGVGEGKDSPGSELIISSLFADDERPVWLAAWSGLNTVAQAIWKVYNKMTPEDFKKFVSKIRIYDILGQDDAGAWIAKNFPQIIYIRNKKVYGWGPSDDWIKEKIQSVKPYGGMYPDRKWASEGDSPSFMYIVANGINVPDSLTYGGWGGRFVYEKEVSVRGMSFIEKSGKDEGQYDPYYMYVSAPEGIDAINIWREHILNDFEARMKWTVAKKYSEANHHPVVVINGDSTYNHMIINIENKHDIVIDASSSFDPDGDELEYKWYVYAEAGTYGESIVLNNPNTSKCHVQIPENAKGKNFHVILVLSDKGIPSLTTYKRIVFNII